MPLSCSYCYRTGSEGFEPSHIGHKCIDSAACDARFDRYIEGWFRAAYVLKGHSLEVAAEMAKAAMLRKPEAAENPVPAPASVPMDIAE